MKRDMFALLLIVVAMHSYALAYSSFTNRGRQPISISSSTQPCWGTRTKSTIYAFQNNDRKVQQMSYFSMDEMTKPTTQPSHDTCYDGTVHSIKSFMKSFNDDKKTPFMKTESGLTNAQLIFNAALLLSAFGYALHTILNIDHGMSRGWNHFEIMMRLPMDNWKGYEDSLFDKPIFTKTMINVIIYLLGDWLSQTIFQKRHVLDFEYKRTIRNGFIGACFGPLVHQYYEFSDFILPVDVGINKVYKIFMDQSIYLTTKVSIYIIAVGLLAGETLDDSVDQVKSKIKPITFTAWKFWPLVHCVTYTVIPAEHRILWVNCVDLIWNAILALMTGNRKDGDEVTDVGMNEDQQETLVDGAILIYADNSIALNNNTMLEIMDESFISRSNALMQDISKDVFYNDATTSLEYSIRGATNDTSMSQMDFAPIPRDRSY